MHCNWESVTTNLQSTVSCLGAKDTTQSPRETLVGLLKKHCCHKKRCGRVGCAAVSSTNCQSGLQLSVAVLDQ